MAKASNRHYVYIYRDLTRKVQYVGYGGRVFRATSHQSGSHSSKLFTFLNRKKHVLEICGPLGSEEAARAIETALISALEPPLNVSKGPGKWRFRRLGVPERFAERLAEPQLTRQGLLARVRVASRVPCLFVPITGEDFGDGRKGYDVAHPPTDRQILDRMDRWWQVGRFVERWKSSAARCPAVLVGIHGRPGSQVVIGAVRIDHSGWETARPDGGLYPIPNRGPLDLDAFNLRGRRIDRSAGIRFGSFKSQFIVLLDRGGRLSGGGPRSR
jgi:hypothetical protein